MTSTGAAASPWMNCGANGLTDNGDDTITDKATGLTWMQQDSLGGMVWQYGLDYCAARAAGGLDNWRLPNAKELQSIVDYTRSPDTLCRTALSAASLAGAAKLCG